MMKHTYIVGVGSNLGERESYISQARALLKLQGIELFKQSQLIETLPEGGVADEKFLNAAWLCGSNHDPQSLLLRLHVIEQALGRIRERRWANRTIDLDILLWRDESEKDIHRTHFWHKNDLIIPHPLLLERSFALIPAADVCPDWIHPLTNQSLEFERIKRFS